MSHLSSQVLTAARSIDSGLLVGRKAWLDDVHSAYCALNRSRITLDTFKAAIVQDVDCRSIMARCDLVQAYHYAKVQASTAHYENLATFNFVRVS